MGETVTVGEAAAGYEPLAEMRGNLCQTPEGKELWEILKSFTREQIADLLPELERIRQERLAQGQ